jgi:tetratricopeptide (TPR) repeat protein
LGQIQRFLDQKDEARHSLERACAFYVDQAQPNDVNGQRELALCYFHLGLLERACGQPAKALLWQQKATAVAREVAHAAPKAPAPRELLWQTLCGLAHDQAETGHPIDALRGYQDALAVIKPLAEEYPLIEDFQGCLAVTYHLLGNAATDAHQYAEAVGFYRQALPVREKLLRANPRSVKRCSDQGGTWHRLAEALEQLQRVEEALAAYQQSSTHARRVCELQPTIVKHRQWLSDRYGDIARLQRELGRPADAAATCLQRKALWPGNPVELYRVANELALCAALVGKEGAMLSTEEEAERRHYTDQALQAFREALHAAANSFLYFSEPMHLASPTILSGVR